jgi:VanZ family protein
MGFIFYNSSNTGTVSNTKSYAIEAHLKKYYFLLKDEVIKFNNNIKYKIQSKEKNKLHLNNHTDKVNNAPFHSNDKNGLSNNDNIINLIIRKNAHAFEYLILALFISNLLFTFKLKGKSAIIYIMFVCLFYAVTDEFHQAFVPDRTSLVSDVLIDFVGSLIGTFMFYLFYYKIFRKLKFK